MPSPFLGLPERIAPPIENHRPVGFIREGALHPRRGGRRVLPRVAESLGDLPVQQQKGSVFRGLVDIHHQRGNGDVFENPLEVLPFLEKFRDVEIDPGEALGIAFEVAFHREKRPHMTDRPVGPQGTEYDLARVAVLDGFLDGFLRVLQIAGVDIGAPAPAEILAPDSVNPQDIVVTFLDLGFEIVFAKSHPGHGGGELDSAYRLREGDLVLLVTGDIHHLHHHRTGGFLELVEEYIRVAPSTIRRLKFQIHAVRGEGSACHALPSLPENLAVRFDKLFLQPPSDEILGGTMEDVAKGGIHTDPRPVRIQQAMAQVGAPAPLGQCGPGFHSFRRTKRSPVSTASPVLANSSSTTPGAGA